MVRISTRVRARALREHGAGRVGVGKNQRPAASAGGRDIVRVLRALVRLAASGRRLDDDEVRLGAERRMDGSSSLIGWISATASMPTAASTALQNGSSRSLNAGHRPNANILSASSRPPSRDLNHVCACDFR